MVRRDLPRGIQAAQIAHAAGESSPGDLPWNTHVVVLEVASEQELLELNQRLNGIERVVIREPDEPYANAAMAIGCAPTRERRTMKKLLSRFPLLR